MYVSASPYFRTIARERFLILDEKLKWEELLNFFNPPIFSRGLRKGPPKCLNFLSRESGSLCPIRWKGFFWRNPFSKSQRPRFFFSREIHGKGYGEIGEIVEKACVVGKAQKHQGDLTCKMFKCGFRFAIFLYETSLIFKIVEPYWYYSKATYTQRTTAWEASGRQKKSWSYEGAETKWFGD